EKSSPEPEDSRNECHDGQRSRSTAEAVRGEAQNREQNDLVQHRFEIATRKGELIRVEPAVRVPKVAQREPPAEDAPVPGEMVHRVVIEVVYLGSKQLQP